MQFTSTIFMDMNENNFFQDHDVGNYKLKGLIALKVKPPKYWNHGGPTKFNNV